jgi:CRP-like cAMP-binding protein
MKPSTATRAHAAPHSSAIPTTLPRSFALGDLIHVADASGIAWRVKSGAVRLDRVVDGERHFAGLALDGDVIGAETLLFGRYAFEARAIGDGALEPWLEPCAAPSGENLLQMLTTAERRAADALALRAGEAFNRVRQLFLMLAGHGNAPSGRRITIPPLRDMAEMTDLTMETVSRAISHWRKSGLLLKEGRRCGRVYPTAAHATLTFAA